MTDAGRSQWRTLVVLDSKSVRKTRIRAGTAIARMDAPRGRLAAGNSRGPNRCGNRPSYSNIGGSGPADTTDVANADQVGPLSLPLHSPR